MKRTYSSRKRWRRHERDSADSSEEQQSSHPNPNPNPQESTSPGVGHAPLRHSRKRQRLQVEVVVPTIQSLLDARTPHSAVLSGLSEGTEATRPPPSPEASRASTPHPTTARTRTASPSPMTSSSKVKLTYLSRTPTKSSDSPPMAVNQSRARPSARKLARATTLPNLSLETKPGPSTPKPAKDLSMLFDFSLPMASKPLSTKRQGGGVKQRMLARSRTSTNDNASAGSNTIAENTEVLSRSTPLLPFTTGPEGTEERDDRASPFPVKSRQESPSKSRLLEDAAEPSPRPLLASSNIRTYAGKSRSFLVALPNSHLASLPDTSHPLLDDEDLAGDTQEDGFEVQESYTDLRLRWGVDNSEDDLAPPPSEEASPNEKSKRKGKGKQVEQPVSLPNGMMNDLKSITELRSKGESRRFLDEVGYLFEGLHPDEPLGVRRSSALEMVTKLCDADFARRARIAGFLDRAWSDLRGAGAGNPGSPDKILDTVLAVFVALVARDPSDLADLAVDAAGFVPVLYHLLGMLDRENDPLWLISCNQSDAALRLAGISKNEKLLLSSLRDLIREKSGVCDDDDDEELVSNRWLVSKTLSVLPPLRHNPSEHPSILKSVSRELSSLPSRISAYSSGLDLFPLSSAASSNKDLVSVSHIDQCLSLLDAFLLGRWSKYDERDYRNSPEMGAYREEGFGQALVSLCVACELICRNERSAQRRITAHRCLESALRVLINLTHDDRSWSEALLSKPVTIFMAARIVVTAQQQRAAASVKHEESETSEDGLEAGAATSCFDCLCLALGLLTNLVQAAEDAVDIMRETMLAYDCPRSRACARSCQCTGSTSMLVCLARVYTDHCQSERELDPIVRGHMAVLFGLLMRGCPDNQQLLIPVLPGTSYKSKIQGLVENAREFALFYLEFAKKVSAVMRDGDGDGEADEEPKSGPSLDLDGREEGMKRMLSDVKGDTVAGDVVLFLERLRDRAGTRAEGL